MAISDLKKETDEEAARQKQKYLKLTEDFESQKAANQSLRDQYKQLEALEEETKQQVASLKNQLERIRSEFLEVLMVLGTDIPIPPRVQQGILGSGEVGVGAGRSQPNSFNDALKDFQNVIRKFVASYEEKVSNVGAKITAALEDSKKELDSRTSMLEITRNQLQEAKTEVSQLSAGVASAQRQLDASKKAMEK